VTHDLSSVTSMIGLWREARSAPDALGRSAAVAIQIKASGGNPSFGEYLASVVFRAIADHLLVNIQADVIHTLHGGAPFGVSESARSLDFGFCTPSAPPSTYTFKLTRPGELLRGCRSYGRQGVTIRQIEPLALSHIGGDQLRKLACCFHHGSQERAGRISSETYEQGGEGMNSTKQTARTAGAVHRISFQHHLCSTRIAWLGTG